MKAIEQLAEGIRAAGLLDNATVVYPDPLTDTWARIHGIVAAIDGSASVNGEPRPMRIGLTGEFPYRLPVVFVLDPTLHGQIPHVFAYGHICFQEQEGLLLDIDNPVGVASEALDRAIQVLDEGLREENSSDFLDELALYWPGDHEGIIGFPAADKFLSIGSFDLGLRLFVRHRDRIDSALSSTGLDNLGSAFSKIIVRATAHVSATATWEDGLYIPLVDDPHPPSPFPLEAWSPEQLHCFIRTNITSRHRRKLARLARRRLPSQLSVILRVPRPRGAEHLVGVRYREIRDAHPLAEEPGRAVVSQFKVIRRDVPYLLARGGALNLRDKKVLLVGCGAVGGHIAMELARAGVGHLHLVDPDLLRPENAYRHVLGMPFLPGAKAELLAAELQQRYPGIHVNATVSPIKEALDRRVAQLDHDLLLSATGDSNVDRWINERLYARLKGQRALLFTWLEPLGIGGHAVLVHGPGQSHGASRGCMDCLFTPCPADDTPKLTNRAAFAAPGQSFTRELAGCGNAFTPYSSLDALRTAGVATRLAIEALRGSLRGPLLRSWKGAATEFRREGYTTSERYKIDAETLERGLREIAVATCRVCGRIPG